MKDERALLRGVLQALGPHASSVIGQEIRIEGIEVAEGFAPEPTDYVARLTMERPVSGDLFISMDCASAIACGGLLVMMQEKVIREKIERGEIVEDDLDAMGECVNQFTTVVNDTMRERISEDYHSVFVGGEQGASAPEGEFAHARASLSVGTVHQGSIVFAAPRSLFCGDEVVKQASEEDESPAGNMGVDLTPEEAAALREATREGFAAAGQKIAVLLPLSRERGDWQSLLDGASVEYAFAEDLLELRALCRAGEASVVVIDADACPSGGLPALARLQGWVDVAAPVVMAASAPTRRHLIACMAAGAATYLVKPITPGQIVDRLEEVRGVWQDLRAAV